MKRWMRDDVTAILAIAYGASISIGMTANLLGRERADRASFSVSPVDVPFGYVAVRVEANDAEVGGVSPGAYSRDVDARVTVVTLLARPSDVKRLEIAAANGRPALLLRSASERP